MKHSAIVAVATIAILLSASVSAQTPQPKDKPTDASINMLVLGDSILWGQGLIENHKAWWLVKTWLNEKTDRDVTQNILAHSGAVVGTPGYSSGAKFTDVDGEVSRAVPTINEELDRAVKSYANPAQVDLILINGCINDVDVRRLLNAGNSTDDVKSATKEKCGAPMQSLLSRAAAAFPNAHLLVTGYFPIISEKTPNSLLMKAVAKMFLQGPQTAALKPKELRARLADVSRAWYQTSNEMLADDAARINSELIARGSRQRVLFVEIPFPPEYAFNGPETRLWSFNASFLRKLLAILTLGRVTLKTNDERQSERIASCKEFYQPPASETPQQKNERERRRMLCRYASLGHPNQKGATVYAEAICARLKALLTESGWLRNQTVTRPLAVP